MKLTNHLEQIKLQNDEITNKFAKYEEDAELLNAELRVEHSNNVHLMYQVKQL